MACAQKAVKKYSLNKKNSRAAVDRHASEANIIAAVIVNNIPLFSLKYKKITFPP